MHRVTRFITIIALGILLVPSVLFAAAPAPIEDTFLKAQVTDIFYTNEREEFGQSYIDQTLAVRTKDGTSIPLLYEVSAQYQGRTLEVGDRVVLGKNTIAGEETYYISDVYRLNALLWVAIFFFVLTVVFIGKRSIGAFLGLAISFLVIIYYLIPQVLSGASPFIAAFVAALLIASVSLFVAHGIYMRTTVAFLSTMITILFSLIISHITVLTTRLSGLGTEEAFYLQFAVEGATIDLRGLLLGGILIGTLGVLDDITTAQAAAIEEIHKADTSLSVRELYKRGLSIGTEHIISLVNTLVLAYTGAALPLILLFTVYSQPIWVTLNSEIIVEELIRMLIGSIALVLAVPLTTLLGAYFFGSKNSILRKKFGHTRFFRSCDVSHPCNHTHK